uniref:Putative secreted protein n=1 Tax=Ixodes scapularis TaxID=6945 RepID=A0A4D5REC7_IXOSC
MSHHCLFVTLGALPFSITRGDTTFAMNFLGQQEGKRVFMPFHSSVRALFLRHLYVSASLSLSTPLCSSRFLTPPASAPPVPACWVRNSVSSALGFNAGVRGSIPGTGCLFFFF